MRPHFRLQLSLVLSLIAASNLFSQEGYVPPRFQSGRAPALPPLSSEGGLVVVEATIAAAGFVEKILVIDDAPPFTDAVSDAVRLWRFRPATSDGAAVSSRASVVALFRAPVLMGGNPPPPARVAAPSKEVPRPLETRTPAFPPQAVFEGVVMVEVEVDAEGRVDNAAIVSSSPGFDDVSLEAARAFRFDPAERDGRPIVSFAIVIFGLPQPVSGPRPRR